LQDVQGNPIAATYTTGFKTEDQPDVSIADISPRQAPVGALVTITGAGYNAAVENRVFFTTNAGYAGYVLGTHVTRRRWWSRCRRRRDRPHEGGRGRRPDPTSNEFTFSLLTSSILALRQRRRGDGWIPTGRCRALARCKDRVRSGRGRIRPHQLDPLKPFYRIAKPAQPALLSGSHLALLPSGVRGYVSRPDDGDVVEVDTDPASGSFGNALATVAIRAARCHRGRVQRTAHLRGRSIRGPVL
jgi:hypothetical protein